MSRSRLAKTHKRGDPLYRGDARAGVALPDTTAETTIVEHLLYLGGTSPFTSTSEDEGVANMYVPGDGRLWTTDAPRAEQEAAGVIQLSRLLTDLKGMGRGDCVGDSAFEVAQARVYAEKKREHLIDWRGLDQVDIPAKVARTFR
jgi:hypothetical protein